MYIRKVRRLTVLLWEKVAWGNFHFSLFVLFILPSMFTFNQREVINSKIRKTNLAPNKGHILERREVISDINGGNYLGRG